MSATARGGVVARESHGVLSSPLGWASTCRAVALFATSWLTCWGPFPPPPPSLLITSLPLSCLLLSPLLPLPLPVPTLPWGAACCPACPACSPGLPGRGQFWGTELRRRGRDVFGVPEMGGRRPLAHWTRWLLCHRPVPLTHSLTHSLTH